MLVIVGDVWLGTAAAARPNNYRKMAALLSRKYIEEGGNDLAIFTCVKAKTFFYSYKQFKAVHIPA